jgi:hypothetical protein
MKNTTGINFDLKFGIAMLSILAIIGGFLIPITVRADDVEVALTITVSWDWEMSNQDQAVNYTCGFQPTTIIFRGYAAAYGATTFGSYNGSYSDSLCWAPGITYHGTDEPFFIFNSAGSHGFDTQLVDTFPTGFTIQYWGCDGTGTASITAICFGHATVNATGPQGPQGEQGPQGTPGTNGTNGSQGPQGDPGANGTQGIAGINGTNGQQGPPGPEGDAGPQGTPGDEGPTGPAGPTGAQGPQGPTGEGGAGGEALPLWLIILWCAIGAVAYFSKSLIANIAFVVICAIGIYTANAAATLYLMQQAGLTVFFVCAIGFSIFQMLKKVEHL